MRRSAEFWKDVEIDRNNGMSLSSVYEKYRITYHIIKRARENGLINDKRVRPQKRDWNEIQHFINDNGVESTLIYFNTTLISLQTARQKGLISFSNPAQTTVFDDVGLWKAIQNFYNDGNSTKNIAIEFKIAECTITKAVKRNLLQLRTRKDNDALNPWTPERRAKQSIAMRLAVKQKPESYSAKNVCGRVKRYPIQDGLGNDTFVLGKWELCVAEILNNNSIVWTNIIDGFPYKWEEEEHLYFPDFYLPELKTYIEVKGYQRDRDVAKWKDFPYNLVILKEDKIKELKRTQNIQGLLA